MPPSSAKRSPSRLQPLLDQQFWCWGQDVRQPPNRLLTYGFAKVSLADRSKGSSRYVREEDGAVFRLWGFGATVTNDEGWTLFVSRFATKPVVGRFPRPATLDVHRAEELPDFRTPANEGEAAHAAALLTRFCRFVTAYEEWVLAAQDGTAHRRRALAQWMHKPCCGAGEVAERWRRLTEAVTA